MAACKKSGQSEDKKTGLSENKNEKKPETAMDMNLPGYITDNHVLLRRSPTTRAPVVGWLYRNYPVKLLQKSAAKMRIGKWNNYWYKIKVTIDYKQVQGWTYGEFVSNKKSKMKTKYRVVNNKALNARLFNAVKTAKAYVVHTLLKQGADPNFGNPREEKDKGGTTTKYFSPVLYEAVKAQKVDVVNILLKCGANPNLSATIMQLGVWVGTPLSAAVEKNNVAMVNILLNAGADPNQREGNGESLAPPLMSAKSPTIVRLLIAKGADVNAELHGSTVLKNAKDQNFHEVVDILKRAGAKETVQK